MGTEVITPENVLVEFLRANITDPRSRDTNTTTETFSGDGSTTEFSFTIPGSGNHLSAVTAVTVGGSSVTKWKDYYVDLHNKKIVFYTAPVSGTDNISVDYKYGNNWIFSRRPNDSDNEGKFEDETDWPLISVLTTGGTGQALGQHGADQYEALTVTIEARAKEDYYPTINGTTYNDKSLCTYLCRQAKKYVTKQPEDMYPELFDPSTNTLPREQPFDVDRQTSLSTWDFTIHGLNTGE